MSQEDQTTALRRLRRSQLAGLKKPFLRAVSVVGSSRREHGQYYGMEAA